MNGQIDLPYRGAPIDAGCVTTSVAAPAPTRLAYKVRVFLVSGEWIDVGVSVPWEQWLERYRFYGGIAHDKGMIERLAVKYILHLDAQNQPAQQFEGNVVPLRGKP